jgi:hypothetical protein
MGKLQIQTNTNTKTTVDPNKAKDLKQNNNQISNAEKPIEKEIRKPQRYIRDLTSC